MLDGKASLQLLLCASEAEKNAFAEAGFKSVRVVDDANSLYVQTVDGWELEDRLAYFDKFVLGFPAGFDGLRDAIAARLDDTACRWIVWPEGCHSAESVVAKHGGQALHDLVKSARPMWTDEVCLLSDVPEASPQRGYITGLPLLDKHGLRLVRPAFMPVIGPYGSGKSVLLRQLVCNLYRLHGWRTLITSFEERVKPRYVRDFRRHLIGSFDSQDRWNNKHESQWTQADVDTADQHIQKAFRFLRRKRNAVLDMDRVVNRIEYAVRVYGLECVVIDPFNEIDHSVPRGENRTDYIGRVIMQLKQLADDYDLLMIVAAHPPKVGVEKRRGTNVMTLNDGADSAHWGNKADIGWCVWRPMLDEDSPTYLNIDKLKDHEVMGQPTIAKLMLDKGLGKFGVTKVGYDVLEELTDD